MTSHHIIDHLWGEAMPGSLVDSPNKAPRQGLNVSFVNMNEQIDKLTSCLWFEIPWHSCDVTVIENILYILVSTEANFLEQGNHHCLFLPLMEIENTTIWKLAQSNLSPQPAELKSCSRWLSYQPGRLSASLLSLTLKRLGNFFQNVILFLKCCTLQVQYFYMKLVQYNECLISIVGADGLVL